MLQQKTSFCSFQTLPRMHRCNICHLESNIAFSMDLDCWRLSPCLSWWDKSAPTQPLRSWRVLACREVNAGAQIFPGFGSSSAKLPVCAEQRNILERLWATVLRLVLSKMWHLLIYSNEKQGASSVWRQLGPCLSPSLILPGTIGGKKKSNYQQMLLSSVVFSLCWESPLLCSAPILQHLDHI